MTQNQIGANTTSSSPFVAPGDVIYFRGTDDRLLTINSDGSNSYPIGTNTTSSTPFVFSDPLTGEWVYFRGTDNRLLKVRGDTAGSDLTWIGENSTNSTPFVTFDAASQEVRVYFQGTDNRLLKVNSDGSNGFQIGTNTTDSAPFVFSDPADGEWVYFRGHNDNKLWKVRGDAAGTDLTQIGSNTTSSTPFVTVDASTNEVWIYFQGTDNKLWKVRNDAAGSGLTHIGGNYTRSSPYVSDDGWVYFQGTDIYNDGTEQFFRGKLWTIFNDGTQQSWLGGNYTASTPKVGATQFVGGQLSRWVYFEEALTNNLIRYQQVENPLATGTARPKYYILTVLYAPPGSAGTSTAGTSDSLVDYGSMSQTGTTTTIASSVKTGFSLQFGTDKNGLQFNFSDNTTDSSSILIQKAETFDIKIPGPAADGIDHNHDVFVLLLNPLLTVAQFPGNNVQVAMGVDGPVMNIQYVYAGWLNGAQAMAPGVSNQLQAAGLDPATDYPQILSTNPFSGGSTVIDTDRFIALPESFAYEPPYSKADAPWVATYTVQNTTTATSTVIVEYSVGATIGVSIKDLFNIGSSVTITNTNTTMTADTTVETASVTVGGPSFGYTGSTNILVYWDSVYHSFMFAYPVGEAAPGSPTRSRTRSGAAKAGKAIRKPTKARRRARA
ncbi:MAG TPA: hypothetical protein VKR62_18055 [Roseiarcus sp.]|nr:hypothetical protein [Roseiarcus sp.]